MKLNERDDFDKWVSQWDAANQNGTFEAPAKAHMPSTQTAPEGFFGTRLNSPSETVPQSDIDYWRDVYSNSRDFMAEPDLDDSVLQENKAPKKVIKENKAPYKAPNPILTSTLGMDQDVKNPSSVGSTFGVTDLESLENLKLKLHGLLDKLNGFEAASQGVTKLESQIQSLQKQIDELSDSLSSETD